MKGFGRKIFGIGLPKTGTSSLKEALEILGYKVGGGNAEKIIDDKSVVYDRLSKYDAFQDVPWPLLYKEVDRWVENSKFVLTTRSVRDWMFSHVKYFGTKESRFREILFGEPSSFGNEKLYMEEYKKYNERVRRYFNGRDDFIELNLKDDNKWEKLCRLLGHEVPSEPFPHANKKRPCLRKRDIS